MKLSINQDTCIGCGMCESICDKCFSMDGDKAKVIKEDGCDDCNVEDAVENCPTNSITIEK